MSDWMTELMRRAEENMDAVAARIDKTFAQVDTQLAELARAQAQREAGEGRAWQALAESPDAPAEWRRVVERVRRGELSWADVASGRLADDPDVAAAILASAPPPKEPASPPEPGAARRGTPAEENYDDEEQITILQRR